MYNNYFKFSCLPFENTLDQQFLFLSESHEEVIAGLLYFVKGKKGFALVCGDVGTGKTMIVHHVLGELPRSVQPIMIPYPDVEHIEILRYIARVLNINTAGKGILDLTDEVKTVLSKASFNGKQVLLIIDEAHLLSIDSLEYIRLLSNIEITGKKLLQILLIGQNELSHKLRRTEMRQLRQRISVNRFLSPMSPSETIEYIDHRLEVAGSSFAGCFESDCKKLIYKMTGGVPRSINRLCDTALLICMNEKGDKVTGRVLKKAHDALHSDVILAPGESKSGRFFSVKNLGLALAGGALVLLLALGFPRFLGYNGNLGENLKGWIYGLGFPKAAGTNIENPLPPVPEVKSLEISRPPEAGGKNTSSTTPGLVTPQTISPAQEPPEVLPKEGQPVANIDMKVLKIEKASPSIEESTNPAPSGESPATDQISNPNGKTTQSQTVNVDEKIALKGGNPYGDAQDLRPSEKALRPSDLFIVTVKKGDSLGKIAAQWFPEDPASGEKSILSANSQIHDKNRILAGQILRIPKARETDLEKK